MHWCKLINLRSICSALAIIVLVLSGLSAVPTPTTYAATYTITKTVDTNDGHCLAKDCSLRDAVIAANQTPGPDTITLPAGNYTLTLTNTNNLNEDASATGDLDVTGDLTIIGAGGANRTTIAAVTNNQYGGDRIFQIFAGASVTLRGITIQNGTGSPVLSDGDSVGGGVYNAGVLTIANSTIVSNTAQLVPDYSGPEPDGSGGGIYNTGTLTITESTLGSNRARNGAGIYNIGTATVSVTNIISNTASRTQTGPGGSRNYYGTGGGVYSTGTLTISRSTIRGNSSREIGGGIYNAGAARLVAGTTVSTNQAEEKGGGIYTTGVLSMTQSIVTGNITFRTKEFEEPDDGGGGVFNSGTLTMTDSTLSLNTAHGQGGGISNIGVVTVRGSTISENTIYMVVGISNPLYLAGNGGGIASYTTLTLVNSTVSGNVAANGGGGISGEGSITLSNVTITGNTANVATGDASLFIAYEGGGISVAQGSLIARNTIIAANTLAEHKEQPEMPSDCSGTLESHGYNLIQNIAGCTLTGDTTSVITGKNPQLGPLSNNGGPTLTHALLGGSPAINAGNPTGCRDAQGQLLMTDQRGNARPLGPRCDIGAFEADPAHPVLHNIYLPLVIQ